MKQLIADVHYMEDSKPVFKGHALQGKTPSDQGTFSLIPVSLADRLYTVSRMSCLQSVP